MKKTREYVNQRLDIYTEGRKAAQENKPRFAPYRIAEIVRTWFAGYDSIVKTKGK